MSQVSGERVEAGTWPWLQRFEDFIVTFFTARGAFTGFIFFVASLMAGALFLKSVFIFLLSAALHARGYGARALEKLALLAIICAAVAWVDVIPFDRLLAYVPAQSNELLLVFSHALTLAVGLCVGFAACWLGTRSKMEEIERISRSKMERIQDIVKSGRQDILSGEWTRSDNPGKPV